MKKKSILLIITLQIILLFNLAAQTSRPPYQYPEQPEVLQKITEWQELKFGLFMHWGPYSQWGVVESWTLCPEDWPWNKRPADKSYFQYVQEYENLATTFNPVKFDPEKWVKAAGEAGMKYVVFTTKHHDGFNMFDTQQSDYKITGRSCPFNQNPRADVTREIFNAFRKENFMIGGYYSTTDWHHNDFWWDYFPPLNRNMNYSPLKYPEKWDRYNKFIYDQLEELSTNYGKVDLLWFDLNGISKEQKVNWQPISGMLRKNQPGIMMVVRGSNDQYENYRTPEQELPEHTLDYPWETCMTMGKKWSYNRNDEFKSSFELIRTLVKIVSMGGNLLLNIGPGPEGDFHPTAYERLAAIGDWMKINGEAIHGTKPIEPFHETKIAFTRNLKNVYAFYLPEENEMKMPARIPITSVQPLQGTKVYLLGYNKALSWKKIDKGFEINIPAELQNRPITEGAWAFKFQIQ